MYIQNFTILNKANLAEGPLINNSFEEKYIQLRSKEQRIYSNKDLLNLPDVDKNNIHYKEWQIRKKSAGALIQHLRKKNSALQILEVGCGNGWLANKLANIPDSKVTGCDINFTELKQAATVFSRVSNLHFIYGDIRSDLFKEKEFDLIIFAASIQYFSSLHEIMIATMKILKPEGEIHIIDSPIYKAGQIITAKERSTTYFKTIGFPEMADYYFHHSLKDLATFKYDVLYKPSFFQRKILNNRNPFPWICIKKQ